MLVVGVALKQKVRNGPAGARLRYRRIDPWAGVALRRLLAHADVRPAEPGRRFLDKQKTAYERSVRDWSSDVCSSDLRRVGDCPAWPSWSGGLRASGTRGARGG